VLKFSLRKGAEGRAARAPGVPVTLLTHSEQKLKLIFLPRGADRLQTGRQHTGFEKDMGVVLRLLERHIDERKSGLLFLSDKGRSQLGESRRSGEGRRGWGGAGEISGQTEGSPNLVPEIVGDAQNTKEEEAEERREPPLLGGR